MLSPSNAGVPLQRQGRNVEPITISSGPKPLDKILQGLGLGDSVVWQLDQRDDYASFAEALARAVAKGRRFA